MFSVSTTAAWSRMAAIHARCDRYFWPILPVRGSTRCGRRSTNVSSRSSSLPRVTRPRSGRVAPGYASSAEPPRRRGPGATALWGWRNPPPGAEPCEPPASRTAVRSSAKSKRCLTSESNRASIARRGLLVLSQNRWGARRLRQSHKTDARARHCRRQLRLPLGDGAAAGVLSARFFLGAGAFLTQVHGGTRRCASPFFLPSFSMLRQALQSGASDAPAAFAAAALAARRGQSSTTKHAPHSSPKVAWDTTSTCCQVQVGRSWRCTRCQPQNKETVTFNQKQNDGIFKHEDLSTLTVIRGEDAVQWTVLLPAQESLLAGDAQQLRLDPRPAIRETTKMCFHAFQVPLQRRGG